MNRNYIFLFIIVLVMGNACAFFSGNIYKNPEKVCKKYLKLLDSKKYEEAKKYCSEDGIKMMDFFISLDKAAAENDKQKNKGLKNEKKKYADFETEINGNEALCSYFLNGEKNRIKLIYLEGKWLVNHQKEDKQEENPE
jgi:hypothetical protein